MDLKQLTYFLKIAEEGTITEAANKLHMAQPPLSQQLKELERELGVRLMNRDRKGVALTEAGKALRERSEQIMNLLQLAKQEVRDIHNGIAGTLSIGTVASSGAAFLPDRIRLYQERYPLVNFQFWEGDTSMVLDLVQHGVAELGIARLKDNDGRYERLVFPPEPFVAAFPERFADSGSGGIELTELVHYPLMVNRRNASMFYDACRKRNVQPRIICEGNDVRTLLAWADSGVGVAVVSRSAQHLIKSERLVYREILASDLFLQRSLFWLKQRELSMAAKHFIELVTVEETAQLERAENR